MNIQHVVSFSGGIASAYAAHRLIERHGRDGVVLLFADTMMEDEDLYRFVDDMERVLGLPITRIADGRTPWEVMRDVRFLGNSRIDPCSKILKRQLLNRWMAEHAPSAVRHVGIWFDEAHRLRRLQSRDASIRWDSPLLWTPWASRADADAWLRSVGINRPRLYDMGFSHNNCGGFCIKAGQAQFAVLYREMPERFRHHEAQEESMRSMLGDVSILTEQRCGHEYRLPLRVLRERIDAQMQIDFDDTRAGCGCAIDVEVEGE